MESETVWKLFRIIPSVRVKPSESLTLAVGWGVMGISRSPP
jgi:hypothetical protein